MCVYDTERLETTWGGQTHYGWPRHNHGKGYNILLFNGSASFQEDAGDDLGTRFSWSFPNIVDARTGLNYKPANNGVAWMLSNWYGWDDTRLRAVMKP
jgi:hypothetical protein